MPNELTLIENGILVTESNAYQSDILIEKGSIAAMGPKLRRALADNLNVRVLDAYGKVITPGGVDVHTHLEYHVGGLDTCDDVASGTLAAVFGGTTTTIDFVEAAPEDTLLQALDNRRATYERGAYTDYSLHMSITPTDMAKLSQIEEVIAAGCPTFKHYMAYGLGINDGQLFDSFKAIAQAGGLAFVHAENWSVIQRLIADCLAQGLTHPRYHPLCRPASLEGEAVNRALTIAGLAECDAYICHMSCHESVEALENAKNRGQRAWGETCPHYLCLNSNIFEELGPLPICSPPIREEAQAQRLLQALIAGQIDCVSTDHCPFTSAEKEAPESFNKVPGGMSSIETRLMLLKSLPGLSPERWVEVCCANPARLMGFRRKGFLLPGYDADLVIWDMHKEMVLSRDNLHERADWNAYQGWKIEGLPQTVFIRGRAVVHDGQVLVPQGSGCFVPRFR